MRFVDEPHPHDRHPHDRHPQDPHPHDMHPHGPHLHGPHLHEPHLHEPHRHYEAASDPSLEKTRPTCALPLLRAVLVSGPPASSDRNEEKVSP